MDINTVQTMLEKIAIFVPITTGIVQAIKIAGFPARFLPLLSVGLGGALGWFVISASGLGIFGGAAIGLASVGLFELGKNTATSVLGG